MVTRHGGMSIRERAAFAVWGVGVVAVVKLAHDVLDVTGAGLAVVAVVVALGSFFGAFLPLWRRLSGD